MRTGVRMLLLWASAFYVVVWSASPACAADQPSPASGGHDWPMYKADAERRGYTAEELPAKLALSWVYRAADAPRPAWTWAPKGRPEYDRVFQPIMAGGLVLFGSSADGKVYALDAATGAERWTFFTEGPIRFAPAAWRDRVFAGSDDGYLYCLELKTGRLLWKSRGGPSDEKVVGNDFVVSRWPIRGGVAVRDNTVYFGAGAWAIDRAYMRALDAETGKEIWTTVTGGHAPGAASGKDSAKDGADSPEWARFAPQGYLAVGERKLLVSANHIGTFVFDRATGKRAYVAAAPDGGGTIVDANAACMGYELYDLETGKHLQRIGCGDERNVLVEHMIVASNRIFTIGTGGGVWEVNRADGKSLASWGTRNRGRSQIGAGSRFYTGGENGVSSTSFLKQEPAWDAPVEGEARGLAAANGRLYVSTTKGYIYCFSGGGGAAAQTNAPKRTDPAADPVWDGIADEILKEAGITEGYCVDLGCGDGRLALALARRSKLYVVGVEKDAEKVKQARLRLDNAGMYGKQAVVLEADPAASGLPKWFANLVVSARSAESGEAIAADKEAARIQRPYGGVMVSGKPGAMRKLVRGPLEGGGSWTHCLADPANTNCSGDSTLKGPLRSYWYKSCGGFNGFQSAPAPMYVNGRLYVVGRNVTRAVDAYNGRILWDLPLKVNDPSVCCDISGFAAKAIGYACVTPEGALYVRDGSKILRIAGETGKQTAAFEVPPESDGKPGPWGFIAYDAGVLYGALTSSYVAEKGPRPNPALESSLSLLTAMDPATGKTKWTYKAKQCIPNSSIAIGAGRVYLVDYPLAAQGAPSSSAGTGELVALDAGDGKVLWRVAADVGYVVSTLSAKHGVLMVGNTVFRTSDGKELWKMKKRAAVLPVFNDRTAYFVASGKADSQAMALDLVTGERKLDETGKPWTTSRLAKSCGGTSGSGSLLLFRSWDLGYCDLSRGSVRETCAGIRPGCFINVIPAGGLVFMPYAAECGCSFNHAWIALRGED